MRDKEIYIMIKGSIRRYNNYKHTCTKHQSSKTYGVNKIERKNMSMIKVGDFHTTLLIMNRTTRQKKQRTYYTRAQRDPIHIYRPCYPKTEKYIFLFNAY